MEDLTEQFSKMRASDDGVEKIERKIDDVKRAIAGINIPESSKKPCTTGVWNIQTKGKYGLVTHSVPTKEDRRMKPFLSKVVSFKETNKPSYRAYDKITY